MLSYHICHIYRTWESIDTGWGGGGILKLSYGGASQKNLGPFLWGKVTPQDTT